MDTFMDKLAQKLTAQEMIKANTAADAEEMNKLKIQVKEYQEILDQMKQLVTDSAAMMENAKLDGSEVGRLVDAGIAKINEIQASTQNIEMVQETLEELKLSVDMRVNEVSEDWIELEETINAKLNRASESLGQLENSIGDKVEDAIGTKLEGVTNIGTKLDTANENIHKECVKVYRNVQAVVVEENNKQTESIVAAVKALKGKLGAVLGISIAALIVALGGVVFQVLLYLQVL